jgi:hypothetical protein
MIAGGVGHFLLVDLSALWLRLPFVSWSPSSIVLSGLEHSTLQFGVLGKANAFHAIAGFSVWVALSLSLLGAFLLRLAAQSEVKLTALLPMCLTISGAFLAVAALAFIWPAALGGVAATALFTASYVRGES